MVFVLYIRSEKTYKIHCMHPIGILLYWLENHSCSLIFCTSVISSFTYKWRLAFVQCAYTDSRILWDIWLYLEFRYWADHFYIFHCLSPLSLMIRYKPNEVLFMHYLLLFALSLLPLINNSTCKTKGRTKIKNK